MTFLNRSYNKEFNLIMRDIQRLTDHAYVATIIEKPKIPQLSLALLYLFFKQHNYPFQQIRTYCTSTILMQMGLDTHNEVTEVTVDPDKHLERQIYVLTGDLYSGKFYQLLAREGAINAIHILSDGVCWINKAKTNIYHILSEKRVNVTQFVLELQVTVSALLKAWIVNEGHRTEAKQWERVVTNLLTAERLGDDYLRTLPSVWPFDVIQQLKQKAADMIEQTYQIISEWVYEDIKRELQHLVHSFFPDDVKLGKIAEDY